MSIDHSSYTHPDLVWVMLVVFNNSEDVWSICFDSPPAAKKTHDSKMPSKNFDNSYPLPFLNTWGANRLNAPRCLERWSSVHVRSSVRLNRLKLQSSLHILTSDWTGFRFRRSSNMQKWPGPGLPGYPSINMSPSPTWGMFDHFWGKQTKSSPTSENKLWSSWLYPKVSNINIDVGNLP